MDEISGFGVVVLFVIGAVGFLLTSLIAGRLLRPNKQNHEKQASYESGEEPLKGSWGIYNVRFYVIALIFLLFEAELVFLFPWAVAFGDPHMAEETAGLWTTFSLIEAFIFIAILGLGLAYVWASGMLDWIKDKPKAKTYTSKIPQSAYEKYL